MHVNTNYLILDHNGEGELIYVPNIERFKKDDFRELLMIILEFGKASNFENSKLSRSNFRKYLLIEKDW